MALPAEASIAAFEIVYVSAAGQPGEPCRRMARSRPRHRQHIILEADGRQRRRTGQLDQHVADAQAIQVVVDQQVAVAPEDERAIGHFGRQRLHLRGHAGGLRIQICADAGEALQREGAAGRRHGRCFDRYAVTG